MPEGIAGPPAGEKHPVRAFDSGVRTLPVPILTLFFTLALAGCPKSMEGPNAGGESHFLRRCSTTCDGDLECISGTCTIECQADDACKDLSSSAVCTAEGGDNDAPAVCDVKCEANADCRSTSDTLDCRNGFCRGPMLDETDAGVGTGDAADSGSSSSAGTASDAGEPPGADAGSSTDVTSSAELVIPSITEECPVFESGTISFMGLDGIQLEAGPKASGPTAPILFYWRFFEGTSGEFNMRAPQVSQGITSQGGVIVSFQNTSGGGDCSCSGRGIFCMSDMDIVDQLVACAIRDHNVDPRRIFTTGCGDGGLFATCLAAHRSTYIAAAAPNSGGLIVSEEFDSDQTPALMTMHGGEGVDVVVFDFVQTSAYADEEFKARGGFVVNCNHGGGHCGGSVVDDQVWEFFQAHPYGVDPYPWTDGLPATFPEWCEIY